MDIIQLNYILNLLGGAYLDFSITFPYFVRLLDLAEWQTSDLLDVSEGNVEPNSHLSRFHRVLSCA